MDSRRRCLHRLFRAAVVVFMSALPLIVRGQAPPGGVQAAPELASAAAKFFEQTCAACHGMTGRGDGPAAVALNPKPADLGDPKFQVARTDVQLREVITSGKGVMAPFGKRLTKEQIEALVQYIRSLKREE